MAGSPVAPWLWLTTTCLELSGKSRGKKVRGRPGKETGEHPKNPFLFTPSSEHSSSDSEEEEVESAGSVQVVSSGEQR